ncbi:OmpH family outer membrane protein [Altericroceibacterium xinjiangense]|uniref:OmpH family outer membrane protein n=1 Tax=Altericroceibacterium xinjiangense TaxID=762261 RepID=UPI000F7E5E02|nr:OmpH family outer membrane protein [Altericroceibacterium xinjiangense]
MKALLKAALPAAILMTAVSPLAIAPAAAQTAPNIGVVNIQAVVANSNAFKAAQQQQQTTYRAQLDQANTRRQAIQAQLQPMIQQLQTASQAANPNQQALQQQAAQLQQIQTSGQRELQQILQPVSLSEAYVQEQLEAQLGTAIQNAARRQNISVVITPDNVLYADTAAVLNQAVLTELNTLVPSVQITPPQGWLPRELREQQAAAGAQQPAQPQQAAPGR